MTHVESWVTDDYRIDYYKDTKTVNVSTRKGLTSDSLKEMMDILGDIEVDMLPVWHVGSDGVCTT